MRPTDPKGTLMSIKNRVNSALDKTASYLQAHPQAVAFSLACAGGIALSTSTYYFGYSKGAVKGGTLYSEAFEQSEGVIFLPNANAKAALKGLKVGDELIVQGNDTLPTAKITIDQ